MLNEKEAAELKDLEAKYLDEHKQPKTNVTVDTDEMVRMAELQAKAEEVKTDTGEISVEELKAIAKEKGIKGYANMKRETLIAAIEGLTESKEAEVTAPEPTETDRLVAQGYKYLGTNGHARFYYGPDKKAYMSNKAGGLRAVGNVFGKRLLDSLKK